MNATAKRIATDIETKNDASVVRLPVGRDRRREREAPKASAEPTERRVSAKRRATLEAARAALAGKVRLAGRLAAFSGGVSAILTALSLTDLASGFAQVTLGSAAQSYAMASGIDLGFAAAELALIFDLGGDPTMRAFARTVVGVTLATSGAMNALAFSGSANPVCRCVGVALGLVVPALVGGLNQICARQVAARAALVAELAAMEERA